MPHRGRLFHNELLAGSAGDDACNLPVVEIDTESTRAIFKDGEVSFAAPDPGKSADAIEDLTRNGACGLGGRRKRAISFRVSVGKIASARLKPRSLIAWANVAFMRLNRNESAPRRSIASHMPRSSSRPSTPDHSSKQC